MANGMDILMRSTIDEIEVEIEVEKLNKQSTSENSQALNYKPQTTNP